MKFLRVLAGAVAGYLLFCVGLFLWVWWRAVQRHYFDGEELFYGVLAPLGAVPTFFTGEWRQYPGWLNARDICAYVLVACGAFLGWRYQRRTNGWESES